MTDNRFDLEVAKKLYAKSPKEQLLLDELLTHLESMVALINKYRDK